MARTYSQGYAFAFNGCKYWAERSLGGTRHFRHLFIMGEHVKDVPQELLTEKEFKNAEMQGARL